MPSAEDTAVTEGKRDASGTLGGPALKSMRSRRTTGAK